MVSTPRACFHVYFRWPIQTFKNGMHIYERTCSFCLLGPGCSRPLDFFPAPSIYLQLSHHFSFQLSDSHHYLLFCPHYYKWKHFKFSCFNIIPRCTCTTLKQIHLSNWWTLRLLLCLACYDSTAMNISRQASLQHTDSISWSHVVGKLDPMTVHFWALGEVCILHAQPLYTFHPTYEGQYPTPPPPPWTCSHLNRRDTSQGFHLPLPGCFCLVHDYLSVFLHSCHSVSVILTFCVPMIQ